LAKTPKDNTELTSTAFAQINLTQMPTGPAMLKLVILYAGILHYQANRQLSIDQKDLDS
jgi:hypothetical protein